MGTGENRRWIRGHLDPYVLRALSDQGDGLRILERSLDTLRHNDRLILADREGIFIQALRNRPGTLAAAMENLASREVTYAFFAHSDAPLPWCDQTLELQRFEFGPLRHDLIAARTVTAPAAIHHALDRIARSLSCAPDRETRRRLTDLIYHNNPSFVAVSPPQRLLSTVTLLAEGNRNGGFSLRIDPIRNRKEWRLSVAVGNPPGPDLLLQFLRVMDRLEIGVCRAYCLTISNGTHPYFLGTFYLRLRGEGGSLDPDSPLSQLLREELVSTLILPDSSPFHRETVLAHGMREWDAALLTAIARFTTSILSAIDPDRYDEGEVHAAFTSHPSLSSDLVELFRIRFAPGVDDRERLFDARRRECEREIDQFLTGSRHRDETRRTIYRTALSFVTRTLRTNAFVTERQALSFRLAPGIVDDAGGSGALGLPPATPFRILFFHSRSGSGFLIGFSDIARGGWRTLVPRSSDDWSGMARNLFREVFVLAHTQHLKNKEIYEGGSKMVTLLEYGEGVGGEGRLPLYRHQYAIAGSLLDIVISRDGSPIHPAVVDHLGRDESIELGPDENMHDEMIEAIAALSRRRGYALGAGIISGKRVGINHRHYGVTSLGVVTFAERTLREVGISLTRDPFTVSMTGGPAGDVAGNCIRILLDRAPGARFLVILDGTALVYDPGGIDRHELKRLLLRHDLDAFDPERLGEGGTFISRSERHVERHRELFRSVTRRGGALVEEWITPDELTRRFDTIIPSTEADLFIPAGGRPETVNDDNWEAFLDQTGRSRVRVIVEGANSFISPHARESLQQRGVLLMRDASANKCGVITSSYEIIANLLMNDEEFLQLKERYVADVLDILERRAREEADLILETKRRTPHLSLTAISEEIGRQIIRLKERIVTLLTGREDLMKTPHLRGVLYAHLPAIVQKEPRLRRRVLSLPPSYRIAIVSAELARSMVYGIDESRELEEAVIRHAHRFLPPRRRAAPAPRGTG